MDGLSFWTAATLVIMPAHTTKERSNHLLRNEASLGRYPYIEWLAFNPRSTYTRTLLGSFSRLAGRLVATENLDQAWRVSHLLRRDT
jgi:hypothetical protein